MPHTLITDALWDSAIDPGDHALFTFLTRGDVGGPSDALTRQALATRARAIAAWLQAHDCAGERVLLLYPPGLGFIEAFFGSLAAGAIAVPAYPPDPRRIERSLDRLSGIVHDCRPRVVLTTRAMAVGLKAASRTLPALKGLTWIGSETIGDDDAAAWRHANSAPDTPAFLQYTSGSTGSPKGVIVTHGNLTSNAAMIARAIGLGAGETGVSWLPVYHDMGLISKVITPAYMGGRVTLLSPLAFLERPMRWLDALSHTRAGCSGAPNFAYDLCARQATDADVASLDLSAWRVAVSGAEPIRPDTLARFTNRFAPAGFRASAFFPAYGLAEATLFVTGKPLTQAPTIVARPAPDHDQVACGVPHGLDVRLVDPATHDVMAAGEVGEVWVAGDSVASGYWNLPEESARTFGARLSSGEGPFLRTGDLGYRHGPELVISGRLKDLLILRGRNYHPIDLEQTVESAHPGIRTGGVAAFAIEHDGEERLAIAAEVKSEFRAQAAAIIDAIRSALAIEQELAPVHIGLLPARTIPKTTSGKIRRRETRDRLLASALTLVAEWKAASQEHDSMAEDAPGVEAVCVDWRSAAEVELWLRSSVARMAGLPPSDVSVDDPIARYGLDSLGVATLATELSTATGRSLPYALAFEADTLRALAGAVAALPDPAAGVERATGSEASYAMSHAQRRMWLAERLHPGSARYHVAAAVELPSPLNERALGESLAVLVDRHAMLRTSFGIDDRGEPIARVGGHTVLDVPVIALDVADGMPADTALWEHARAIASTPFDWSSAPLARLERVTISGGRAGARQVLLAVMPHVVCDGVSLALMLRDLPAVYEGAVGGGLAPPFNAGSTYADIAEQERAWLASPEAQAERAWWRHELAGFEFLRLPVIRDLPAARSAEGGTIAFTLSRATGESLRARARQLDASPFAIIATSFAAVLRRYCGQNEIPLGTMATGRAVTGASGVFGMFVNPIVVRVDLGGDPTFASAVTRARTRIARSLAHQRLPYDEVVAAAPGPDRTGLDPLIQASVVMTPMSLHEGTWSPVLPAPDGSLSGHARTELSLQVAPHADGSYTAALEFSTDRIDEPFGRGLAGDFVRLIERALTDPAQPLSSLQQIDDEEMRTVLGFSGSGALLAAPPLAIHECFEAQVDRTSDAVAVSCGDRHVTYRELDAHANHLARQLLAAGITPGSVVGILGERSPETIAAIFGVLKTGAAYVPIDTADPPARVLGMLRETGARIVIGSTLPDGFDGTLVTMRIDAGAGAAAHARPAVPLRSDQLAYVMFTSGSTGAPKGVMVEHGHVTAFLAATTARLPVATDDTWLAITRLAFDPSILEIIWPLTRGMRVIVGPDQRELDELAACLRAEKPTHVTGTPSMFAALLEHPDGRAALANVKELLVGGETLRPALARALSGSIRGRVWNMYGPTEAVVDATGSLVTAASDPITIGAPLANMLAYVLDPGERLVPVGVEGELHLGGPSVARGYWGAPELTAARFISNPFGPGRLFKTGDRVRWTASGALQFIGRADGQIKIRGFRLETGEVAGVLMSHDGVRDAHVAVFDDGDGRKRLIAYVAAEPPVTAGDLRQHASARLGGHAVPSAFVVLDALPRTANGKIDTAALPPPVVEPEVFVAPRTASETLVVSMAESLLGHSPLGVTDHFFERGGDSLMAVQLLQRLEAVTGRSVPMREFYDAPTFEALAASLSSSAAASPPPEVHDDDVIARRCGPREEPAVIAALLAHVGPASDTLHAQLASSPIVDRYSCGQHQALALQSGYRAPLVVSVPMGDRSDAFIEASLSALFEQQGLLRTAMEQDVGGYVFAERAALSSMSIPVLDACALGREARDVLRSQIAASLHARALADPAVGAFQTHAVIVRVDRREAEVWMALSQTISDRAAGRILRQLLPAGGRSGSSVTRPYKEYLARNRRSIEAGTLRRYKESAAFAPFRDASLAAQTRFPLGAASVHSDAWRGSMTLGDDVPPMQVALNVTLGVLRLLLGTPSVPLRVLTHRRLDNRAQHFLTLGDFHDSVPVLFEPEGDGGSCLSQFARVDRQVRDEGLHVSSLGVDAEILHAVFDCPFNLNFIGDLSPEEEHALVGSLAPLAFVAYPVLSYTVGRRLEIVLLHGVPAEFREPVQAAFPMFTRA